MNDSTLNFWLQSLRSNPRQEEWPWIGQALRQMYWHFSFDIGAPRPVFSSKALQFIRAGGMHVLCALAVEMTVPCGLHVAPEDVCDLLDGPDPEVDFARVFFPTRQTSFLGNQKTSYLGNLFQSAAMPENLLFTHPLLDTPFFLPPAALSYTAMQPNHAQEQVTLRQLVLEILSEMTNYREYRAAIGSFPGALLSMMSVFQAMVAERIRLHWTHLNTQRFDSHRDMFLLDRFINIFANLTFDGCRSKMTLNHQCFRIHSTRQSARPSLDTIPSSPLTSPSLPSPALPCSGTKNEPDLLVCFQLQELTPWMLLAADTVHVCAHTLRNISRFFCNSLIHATDRVLYRVARYDPVRRVRVLGDRLCALVDGNERLEHERVGVQAADVALNVFMDRFRGLYLRDRMGANGLEYLHKEKEEECVSGPGQ